MNTDKIGAFFESVELFCDKVVAKFHNSNEGFFASNIVTKIQNLGFMKKLIHSKAVNQIQDFTEDQTKSFFMVIGTLVIFRVLINSLNLIVDFSKLFSYGWSYFIFYIMHVIVVFVSFIAGVGLIKLKRRVPFITIVVTISFFISLILQMFNLQIIGLLTGMEINFEYVNFFEVFLMLSIILAVGLFVFAMTIKNKRLFIN